MLATPISSLRRLMREAWNDGRLDVLDQVYMPDCVSHDISPGGNVRHGVAEQKAWILATRAAFPDLNLDIQDSIAARDNVILRWVSAGTHRGVWMGIQPTQDYVVWGGITQFHMLGPRVQEEWVAPDLYAMWQQLGQAGLERAAGQ